jgi:hypothetical protein
MTHFRDIADAREYPEEFRRLSGDVAPSWDEVEKYIRFGEDRRSEAVRAHSITLEHVGVMKLLCDAYLCRRLAEALRSGVEGVKMQE